MSDKQETIDILVIKQDEKTHSQNHPQHTRSETA